MSHGLVHDRINNPKTADCLLVVPKLDIIEIEYERSCGAAMDFEWLSQEALDLFETKRI